MSNQSENKSEKGGCWNAFKVILALFFIFGLIGMCFFDNEEKEQDSQVFSFTVNEFVSRYNQSAEKVNTRSIAIVERQEIADGISYKLTKGIHNKEFNLSVTTNKSSDIVRSITYMVSLVSNDTSLEVLLRFTTTIMAVENPNMLPKDRGQRLTEIGVFKIFEDKQTITTEKNNIEYKVDLLEEIATFILSIKPSEGRYN